MPVIKFRSERSLVPKKWNFSTTLRATLCKKTNTIPKKSQKIEINPRTAWGSFNHETSTMCAEANPRAGLLFSFRRVLTVLGMFYLGLLPFVDVPETHFEIPGTLDGMLAKSCLFC